MLPPTDRGIEWRIVTEVTVVMATHCVLRIVEVYEYKIENISSPISDKELHHEHQIQHKVCYYL